MEKDREPASVDARVENVNAECEGRLASVVTFGVGSRSVEVENAQEIPSWLSARCRILRRVRSTTGVAVVVVSDERI